MDGLMSDAMGFILSPGDNLTTGSDKVLKWDTSEVPEYPTDLNSITLLRRSITDSIRNRSIESEVNDSNVSKSSKNKKFKETNTKRTKVKSRLLLDHELSAVNPETSATDEDDQKESNFTVKAFCELLKEKDGAENDSPCIPDTQNLKKDHLQTNELNEEQNGRRKSVQNSMKLASRHFSDNIFENCSTYNMTCDGTCQEKMAAMSPELVDPPVASETLEKHPTSVGDANPEGTDVHKNCSTDDDDMNLRDSFFVDLTSDGEAENSNGHSRHLSKFAVSDNFIQSKKHSRTAEDGTASSEDMTRGKGAEIQQRCERRLSKKLRKRSRRSKSGDVPTYQCTKCGVSYILSTKASERTARCLHCDFWTSVEPEFVKREKQPWNTCRIC